MTPPIRCLIVDDESLARETLRSLVSGVPQLALAGESKDGPGAVRAIESLRPDLLFLDIQMPQMDGFDVLHELLSKGVGLPATIFVTAHDRYALRAFEAHALDYLLKPVGEERFRDTVALAMARIHADRGVSTEDRLATLLARSDLLLRRSRRLPVKTDGVIRLVPLDQVEWIEAEGNYVRLHLFGRSHLVRDTMSALEARLEPGQFARIHRSAMVNIQHLESLRPWFTGEFIVRMRSGKELTLTRRYRDQLHRLLDGFEI